MPLNIVQEGLNSKNWGNVLANQAKTTGWALCVGSGISRGAFPDWVTLVHELIKKDGAADSNCRLLARLRKAFSLDALVQAAQNRLCIDDDNFIFLIRDALFQKIKAQSGHDWPLIMPFQREIRASYGSVARVGTIDLIPAHGQVTITSDPPDAEFQLSNPLHKWSGNLPFQMDIPTGDYQLITRRNGWELNTDISVARGGITTNNVEFPYGSIEVTSDPSGLLVLNSGEEIGKTPLTLRVKPGQYTLTASDGENDLLANVSVGPKEAAKHAFVFHYGTVQLSSTPTGATVIRKGKEIGKTPLTLDHIPAGDTMIELQLQGYQSTNVSIQAVEGSTINLSAKLISERYFQAMKQAREAFDAAQFAESQKFLAVALESEPNDPVAIGLQDEVSKASLKAEEAQKETERKAEEARKETEQKLAAGKNLEYENQFQQIITSIRDAGIFADYTREYSLDFSKVWNAVIKTLKQQGDKSVNENFQTGIIVTDLTRHGLIGFPHYDRYLLLLERIDSNTTKLHLKLMIYWVDFSNSMNGIQRPQGGAFYQNRLNDFFGKIDRELKTPSK